MEKKEDQAFFELVAEEYNTSGMSAYENNAHPHLKKGRFIPHSYFQPIDWVKCRDSFKVLCNDYDVCFKDWVSTNDIIIFYMVK